MFTDERIIELGEYPPSGLPYVQGEQAKAALTESLRIVLADQYLPPSPLREVGANRSIDQLAPENPLAAEMAQIRETLEDINKRLPRRTTAASRSTAADVAALRVVIERNMNYLDSTDFDMLTTKGTSSDQDNWTAELEQEWQSTRAQTREREPDPWATPEEAAGGFSEEPPF